jgi:hypothetical protein
LSFVFYVPRLLWKILRIKDDKNVIHPGGGPRKLSGNKLSATSTDILFKDVEFSKSRDMLIWFARDSNKIDLDACVTEVPFLYRVFALDLVDFGSTS